MLRSSDSLLLQTVPQTDTHVKRTSEDREEVKSAADFLFFRQLNILKNVYNYRNILTPV